MAIFVLANICHPAKDRDGKRLILIFMIILFMDDYVSNFSGLAGLAGHFTLPSSSCDERLIVAVSKLFYTWSVTSEQSIWTS